MSNNDSFIDEVTEEVRRDRLFAVMRKYGWIGIVAVLLIVGGAGWNEWQKSKAQASAQAFGDAVLAGLKAEAPARTLAEIGAGGDQRAVLALLVAGAALDAGDRDTARARLEEIAADPALPVSYRHLAQLKLVILAADTMAEAEREATLQVLAAPGAPFRALALEQQALALVAAGKTEAAIAALRAILQEPELSPALQGRVTQLIVSLGGDTDVG